MINNILTTINRASYASQVTGDEKAIVALLNYWDPETNQPVFRSDYSKVVAEAVKYGIPITTLVIVNLSNSWIVDYKTPANDNMWKWIKQYISSYSNSVMVAFSVVKDSETVTNMADKISFYLEMVEKSKDDSGLGLPVIAQISDTNLDDDFGKSGYENLASCLRDRILCMYYEKEKYQIFNPPCPTDYDALNVFYTFVDGTNDNLIVSAYPESNCAAYLGVASLGATNLSGSGDNGDSSDSGSSGDSGSSDSGELAVQAKRFNDMLEWLLKKFFNYSE